MDDILAVSGVIAGLVTFVSLIALVFTIWLIVLCFRFLDSSIERNKAQIKLAEMQIQELEYKRNTHYSMEASYFETQTKLANKELAQN